MMNEHYLRPLDYMTIVEQLAEHTSFSASRELALRLRPSDDPEEVSRRLQETTEAKDLLAGRPDVTVGGARDVRALARRAALEATLQPSELLEVRATLQSARTLRTLLLRLETDYPLLAEYGYALDPLVGLIEEISRCLDDDGNVLDSASPELARLRRESAIARDRVVERLRSIITAERNAPYLQEAIVTERSGRYVIPLKAQFKGRIPGIVHDVSSSGATVFIEPLATVELNNRWHELQIEERHEVERILSELTRAVGAEDEAIVRNVEVLAEIDLALAKGRYSFDLRGVPAALAPAGWPTAAPGTVLSPSEHPLHLARARHPLLPEETVVPIDVYAGGDYSALLITGPNTGGKTVALKTVGLLAAMTQAGMHIPAQDGSRLPVFSGIYADIGDEQSIEQSLSTFSSHISHIIDILAQADERSLVLLDELGAGTDPVEGSALAQALVQAFLARRVLLVCTTHYSQLKVYAFSEPLVQNASVEFDVETLSPTYRLRIGLPGRSNAFSIARRLGMDEAIIAEAASLISAEDRRSEELLAHVATASEQAERARGEAGERLAEVRALERNLRERLEHIEEARRQVLEEARAEGRRELETLRAELRALRARLAPRDADTARAVREATERVERLEEAVAPLPAREEAPAPEGDGTLQVGDMVRVTSLQQTGELLSLSDSEAEVRIGGFRLRTTPARLRFESRPKPAPAAASSGRVGAPAVESPGTELDMRGWRAEEVAPALEKNLDRAYLAGLPWVNIIHGKGMGVLKQVVRDYLAGHPLVASARPGAEGEGGDGVTIVKLQPRRP